MKQAFRYGDGSVTLDIQNAASVTVLNENPVSPLADPQTAFLRAITEDAIGTKPLDALLSATDEVTIVISDVTRMWMHQDRITEWLVRFLSEQIGIPFANICVLIALGTHRPQTDAEMRRTASDYAFEHVRCLNHDAHADDLVSLGVTSRGTQVRLNPLVIGRKVIMIGGTVYHLLAGFGGGRKSLLPGVSGWDTIQHNHSLALHPTEPRSDPAVGLGLLPRNPVHEDMMEAMKLASPLFSINLVVDSQGRYVGMPSGEPEAAWLRSCELARTAFGVPIDKRYDVVITSAGGYPKDIDLYQGSKTLINAMQAVKDGGTVVFLEECREGGGPAAFFDWIKPLREGRLDEALRADFTIAGYIFYALCAFAKQASIRMLTTLPKDQAGAMGIFATENVEELMQPIDLKGKQVLVIPFGANVVPLPR